MEERCSFCSCPPGIESLFIKAPPALRRAPEETEQVSMLDLGSQQVAQRLRMVDVNTLTPIEAMNLLYELKQMV